jgi:hypothetical protein
LFHRDEFLRIYVGGKLGNRKFLESGSLVTWVGLGQSKKGQLFAFSHHENEIAGYKDFHDPLRI